MKKFTGIMPWAAVLGVLTVVGFVELSSAGPASPEASRDPAQYPEPRFPSYLKVPRSIEDVMPQARALVHNKGGNQGISLGYLDSGETVLIVPDTTAEDMMLEAIRRALVERGVKVQIVSEYELIGATREEALTVRKATEVDSAENGFKEIRNYWLERVFADPEVPKKWLKERRPDLYDALYPKRDELSPHLKTVAEKLKMNSVGSAIRQYLEKHPEIRGVYWGKAGGGFYGRYMAPLQAKFMGFCTFSNHWEMMSEIPSFPAQVFHFIEEKSIESIADVDKVHVTDPEGTDVSWDVSEELARRWAKNVYWRNHLLMYPDTATGQYGYSMKDYPALNKEWMPREPIALIHGVIAGTNGSGGFWPRMEVHFKNGYLTKVKGGGVNGDIFREFLKYPHIDDLTYPFYNHPGFWHLWELALGTHPKYFRNPSDFYESGNAGIYCLTYERYRTGVFHWGFGNELANEPGSYGPPPRWLEFAAEHNLPNGHNFHMHNYFVTYKVHLRNNDKWVTLVDRGHLTSLDDPGVRALASRYGDPDRILSEDWIPEIPGINAPGRYEDYARNPWTYARAQMEKILAGTYEHYYPRVKARK